MKMIQDLLMEADWDSALAGQDKFYFNLDSVKIQDMDDEEESVRFKVQMKGTGTATPFGFTAIVSGTYYSDADKIVFDEIDSNQIISKGDEDPNDINRSLKSLRNTPQRLKDVIVNNIS